MPIKSMEQGMHEFKQGEMHSGSPKGPIVTNRDQAIAISLNSIGKSKNMHGQNKRQAALSRTMAKMGG